MAEILTMDRVRNAGWYDTLLGCINRFLKDPNNIEVRDKILEAIERGGLVSRGVIAVVGIYQRQTITIPGLYKEFVRMEAAITKGQAPPPNGASVQAPVVPPVEVPEPVMVVTEHLERPEPTPEAHPVPEVLPTAESVATSPPAEVHVEPTPSEAEHPAPVGGKPPGNVFRRKSSAFYFLEVMRDGGPRSREDVVAVALKRWPASEIGENAAILHKLNWSMFLRQVRDRKADAHGWTYGLEKVDGTRVRLRVTAPPAGYVAPSETSLTPALDPPAVASAVSGDPTPPLSPELPADAMPVWAEPLVVTPAPHGAAASEPPICATYKGVVLTPDQEGKMVLLQEYERAALEFKAADAAHVAAHGVLNQAAKTRAEAEIKHHRAEQRLLAALNGRVPDEV
jgi:hypothetical protein